MAKNTNNQKGFTIVELLIVIVVIAILAAIVIVAYQGITTKANTTKAQTNGVAAQKVAEIMNADNGSYPATAASFNTGSISVKMPTGVTVSPGSVALSSANGATVVTYACLTTCTSSTGGRVGWWSFSAGATQYIYVGAATSAGTFVNPAT